MINLNDDILNKYIDGDLSEDLKKETAFLIESSEEYKLRYNRLLNVHKQLQKLEPESISADFTSSLMKIILKRKKAIREQTIFIYSMSSVFALIIMIIIGVLIAVIINNPGSGSGEDSQLLTNAFSATGKIFSQVTKNFSGINIPVIGSALSLFILFSAYYFFDNLKQFRDRLKKAN
jgi:anti-sigma factor RsiW